MEVSLREVHGFICSSHLFLLFFYPGGSPSEVEAIGITPCHDPPTHILLISDKYLYVQIFVGSYVESLAIASRIMNSVRGMRGIVTQRVPL